MTEHLSTAAKLSIAVTPTAGAAGVSAITGATLDMSGFEGVLIVVPFGAIVAGAVTSIKAQRGQIADMSDAADLQGSNQAIADTDDDKTFYIDIHRPAERYVRLMISRGTQNATVGGCTYIQYGAHEAPVTHGSNIAGEKFVDAVEGTA